MRVPLILALFLAGCSEELYPPVPPDSNDRILRETVLGGEQEHSWINFLAVDDQGNAYFGGTLNDRLEVGRVGSAGSLNWHKSSPVHRREVHLLPLPFAQWSELLIVVGFDEYEPDKMGAAISLFDVDGTELSTTAFEDANYSTWINDIVLVDATPTQAHLVASGGARQGDTTYPYLARISILDDGTTRLDEDEVLLGDPGEHIWWMAWNGNPTSPQYFGSTNPDSQGANSRVFAFSDSFAVDWRRSIVPGGATSATSFEIEYSNGSVYTVGSVSIPRGDRHKFSGLIAAVSETGSLVWTSSVTVSDLTDWYFDCAVHQGALYAVGETAHFSRRSNNTTFGNALLSKFTLLSGKAVFHKSFGDPASRSQFQSVNMTSATAVCGGYTNYRIENYWLQGWLAEIDVSDGATQLAPNATAISGNVAPDLQVLRSIRSVQPGSEMWR